MATALYNRRGRSLHILGKILQHRGVEFSKARRYSQSITTAPYLNPLRRRKRRTFPFDHKHHL